MKPQRANENTKTEAELFADEEVLESFRDHLVTGTQSRREFLGRAVATFVFPTLLGGLAARSNAAAPPKLSTLVIAMNQGQLRTLDPGHAYENEWMLFGRAIYDQLVTYRQSTLKQVVANLASTWDVGSDGLTYVFHLNSQAKFWDGTPVAADDVVFSFTRFLNMKGPGSFLLDGVKSIEKVGPNQVKITLESVNAALLPILTSPSISVAKASAIKAHGGTDAADAAKTDTAGPWLDQNSVGSGPFVLESWVRGSQLVLKRNPNYWGKAPNVSRVIAKFVTEANTQYDLLVRGDAHVALDLTPDIVANIEADKKTNIQIVRNPGLWINALQLHVSNNPAFAKPANWDAVKYAIDYDGLRSLYRGAGGFTGSVIPPSLPGALPVTERLKQDLTKAKNALAAAGNPSGFSFVMTVGSDAKPGGIPSIDVAQKLRSDLAKVGINSDLRTLLQSQALTEHRAGKLEAIVHGWRADFPSWTNFLPVFAPGGSVGLKRDGWKADSSSQATEIANITKEALRTVDVDKQLKLVAQAQRVLNQHGPYAFLFEIFVQYGVRKDIVKRLDVYPIFYMDLETVEFA